MNDLQVYKKLLWGLGCPPTILQQILYFQTTDVICDACICKHVIMLWVSVKRLEAICIVIDAIQIELNWIQVEWFSAFIGSSLHSDWWAVVKFAWLPFMKDWPATAFSYTPLPEIKCEMTSDCAKHKSFQLYILRISTATWVFLVYHCCSYLLIFFVYKLHCRCWKLIARCLKLKSHRTQNSSAAPAAVNCGRLSQW